MAPTSAISRRLALLVAASLNVRTCFLLSSLAWAIFTAPSSFSSVSLISLSLTFLSSIPNTIWSFIIESLRVPKLHDCAFIFKSVTKPSTLSPGCCSLERNTYLSYVSFFFGEQYASNLASTVLNLDWSSPSSYTKVLYTSMACGPAIVSNNATFLASGLLSSPTASM